MRLPKTDITISKHEYQLVRPGLELLANGLASAKLGSFPHRNAWDCIDAGLSNIYKDRTFDSAMAARIVSARGKLNNMKRARKVQLDVFELAALALAFRVSRSQSPRQSKANRTNEEIELPMKLERNRKNALRLAVSKVGHPEFKLLAKNWREFVQWARYGLLQFKIPKMRIRSLTLLWRDQRDALSSMIRQALEEHCHAPLTAEQMTRMVKLAKESFHRGRQPMTLRQLLAAERPGRDLLFSFVDSRLELTALPGAIVPGWKAAMERYEKFSAYLPHRTRRL